MHFLLKARIPVEVGNALIHDPNMGKTMEDIMGDIKPEAAYFYQLPGICEPLWNTFKADIEMIPAMTQEEFAKAAPDIERVSKKY